MTPVGHAEIKDEYFISIAAPDHKPFGPSEWRVFDLSVDPGESKGLSAEMPELKQRLIEAWDEYAESVGVIPPRGDPFATE